MLEKILPLIDMETLVDVYQYDVDDWVHEAVQEDETLFINPSEGEEEFDLRSKKGSDINNEGMEKQLAYLLSQGWTKTVEDILKDCATSSHARMEIEKILS